MHPDWQRKTIGQQLLDDLLSITGKSKVSLHVGESNFAAQSLYNKYGFEVDAIIPSYYTDPIENAYFMQKRCSNVS